MVMNQPSHPDTLSRNTYEDDYFLFLNNLLVDYRSAFLIIVLKRL